MDTRWKNIISSFIAEIKASRRAAGGLLLGCLSAAGFVVFFKFFTEMTTMRVWAAGLVIDAMLAPAVYLLLTAMLHMLYEDWRPQSVDFYEEWKEKKSRQQRILNGCAVFLLAGAYMFFTNMVRGVYYYYWNYATGYFLFFTVILVYAVCQFALSRFMRGKLNDMMDKVLEINKERLAEAIEIERKSLEKAAKSEQLKVDLISNVSHDLKTPLTSMVGYLELLKKEPLDDVSRDYVDVISDKAEKLKEMIESLFSLAKASSGNIRIRPEPVELNRLIEQIFADMEDRINSSGLHFVTSMTEESTLLITDNLHMYRICQNLIENALKYSAKGTRVFVKTFFEEGELGRRLCLEITNTAGYFMDFDKEDIVERFARGDKARSSDGNGLGLAIVSTYAGALGGAFDIHIDCDQFKAALSFPAAEKETAEEAAENEAAETAAEDGAAEAEAEIRSGNGNSLAY